MSRPRELDDAALGDAVRAAGVLVRWPETPDVAPAVRRRIAAVRPRPGIGPVWPAMPRRRRLLVMLAVTLVLLGGAAFAAGLAIDLGAVTITTLPGRPTALPTGPVAGRDFGTPVSLEEAERLTGIAPRYPAALGPPGVVWAEQGQVGFDPHDTAPWIAMAWDPGNDLPAIAGTDHGAVLFQFRGEVNVAAKVLFEEAGSIQPTDLGTGTGYWVTGPHEFRVVVGGTVRAYRVDGGVLLWQNGDETFRLETALPRNGAMAIAETLPG